MDMILNLAASKPPIMEINEKTANITLPTHINAAVKAPNGTKAAFVLQIVIWLFPTIPSKGIIENYYYFLRLYTVI